MARGLILALAVTLAACGSRAADDGSVRAHIAEGVALTLPSPPGYPETRTIGHIVRAQYGERSAAFEAIVGLSPEEVTIVITIFGGPRVATLVWNEAGVREDRTLLAPAGVPVENILSDIFLVVWPNEVIVQSLPEDVELVVDESGLVRRLQLNGETLVEIATDRADPSRTLVRNLAFKYEVEITTRVLE